MLRQLIQFLCVKGSKAVKMRTISIICSLLISPFLFSQTGNIGDKPVETPKGFLVPTVYYQGDTIPYVNLNPVVCSSGRVFKSNKERVKWDRLKYNVKKVYPYAILAAAKLKEYDRMLAKVPEDKRKGVTKVLESQLKAEFSDELKKLTVTQGRLLIKLIDRETSRTTYDIVKDMRGSFSAFMWQSVALMFNSSLKTEYDAEGADKEIEAAIKLIESGDF